MTLPTLIKHRIKEIIIFALLFTILGHYIPAFYLKYIDNRDYYIVDNVVVSDRVRTCEIAEIQFERTALTDLEIERKVDLIRINHTEQQAFTYDLTRDFAKDGTLEVETTKEIPCYIKEGTYKFRFFISYTIFNRERIYIFESSQFQITN